jgi:hypothetical protein
LTAVVAVSRDDASAGTLRDAVGVGTIKRYVHEAYFDARDKGERCGAELAIRGFRVGTVKLSKHPAVHAWLLRVARQTSPEDWTRENRQVSAIVMSYGGRYHRGYWAPPSKDIEDWGDPPPPTER